MFLETIFMSLQSHITLDLIIIQLCHFITLEKTDERWRLLCCALVWFWYRAENKFWILFYLLCAIPHFSTMFSTGKIIWLSRKRVIMFVLNDSCWPKLLIVVLVLVLVLVISLYSFPTYNRYAAENFENTKVKIFKNERIIVEIVFQSRLLHDCCIRERV